VKGSQASIDPLLFVGAVLFSTLVAMVSGLYPAWKASNLSPVEAINRRPDAHCRRNASERLDRTVEDLPCAVVEERSYLVRVFDQPPGVYRLCGLADDNACIEFRRAGP
jgi:hypothetical protein